MQTKDLLQILEVVQKISVNSDRYFQVLGTLAQRMPDNSLIMVLESVGKAYKEDLEKEMDHIYQF